MPQGLAAAPYVDPDRCWKRGFAALGRMDVELTVSHTGTLTVTHRKERTNCDLRTCLDRHSSQRVTKRVICWDLEGSACARASSLGLSWRSSRCSLELSPLAPVPDRASRGTAPELRPQGTESTSRGTAPELTGHATAVERISRDTAVQSIRRGTGIESMCAIIGAGLDGPRELRLVRRRSHPQDHRQPPASAVVAMARSPSMGRSRRPIRGVGCTGTTRTGLATSM